MIVKLNSSILMGVLFILEGIITKDYRVLKINFKNTIDSVVTTYVIL